MKVKQLEIAEETADGGESTLHVESTDQIEPLPLDTIFDVLSNTRRRQIIEYLTTTADDRVEVRELTDQITAWENDISIEEVTYKERKRVYTSLYQSHLPKMDRLGIVDYDQRGGWVERTQLTEQLGLYLASLTQDEDESERYGSIAVATLCVAFVGLAWAGILPFLSQTGFVTAAIVAVVFFVVAGIRLSSFTDLSQR